MLTNFFLAFGLTRDSAIWLWSRLVTGALLLISGVVPLDGYITPKWQKMLTVACVVILWLAGKFDSSPLPGKKE